MDEVDYELELLRQAALTSLQKNRATKAGNRKMGQGSEGSSTLFNTNRIPTTRLLEIQDDDEHDCEEIVIAEGLDVNDSDCDEVIEEVLLSDGDEESARNSRNSSEPPQNHHKAPSLNSNHSNQSEGSLPPRPRVDEESSSDDDALSVASRYSLYEDEPEDENKNNSIKRLPLRLRPPPSKSEEGSNQKEMRRTRSRSPFQAMGKRRRRSRSPPFRRRPSRRSRSRSHGREFRRRSLSRDRDSTRETRDRLIENPRDKVRRKEESRRPVRSSPSSPPPHSNSKSSRNHQSSRRRSRSTSRDNNNKSRSCKESNNPRSSSKKGTGEVSTEEGRKSPEPTLLVSGADQEVLEKRRRKFQDRIPLNSVEGKKIRLQSKVVEKESVHEDEDGRRDGHEKSVQKSIVVSREKDSSSEFEKGRWSKEVDDRIERKKKSALKTIKDEDCEVKVEAEEEDLRAKLIKRKMKAQGNINLGSGRLFTEALKGTRLISNSHKESSSRKSLKRKVSLIN